MVIVLAIGTDLHRLAPRKGAASRVCAVYEAVTVVVHGVSTSFTSGTSWGSTAVGIRAVNEAITIFVHPTGAPFVGLASRQIGAVHVSTSH